MNTLDPFDIFSDDQLKAELARRILMRKTRLEAERRSREVVVECPNCSGLGRIPNNDTMRVSSGEADQYIKCTMCNGTGQITAYAKYG